MITITDVDNLRIRLMFARPISSFYFEDFMRVRVITITFNETKWGGLLNK